jgi:hypothetical protein
MIGLVLQPEELKGDAFAPQLSMEGGPLAERPLGAHLGRGWHQQVLERGVVHPFGGGPGDTRGGGPSQVQGCVLWLIYRLRPIARWL